MSYYYAPPPVEQAVIEMVGLDLQQRSNFGIMSKNIGGSSVTYDKSQLNSASMTSSVKELLQPYKRMLIA